MDCSKLKSGKRYEHNRKIQKIIEKYMEVEPGTMLMCLGDFNARTKEIEPKIRNSDENGKMLEEWTKERGLYHLNQDEKCRGRYTFGKTERRRSAIDHILVNGKLEEKFKGMDIDEEGIIIDMSDHNLIRAWFDLKHKTHTNWKDS